MIRPFVFVAWVLLGSAILAAVLFMLELAIAFLHFCKELLGERAERKSILNVTQ